MKNNDRIQFATRLGAIAATAGSAVGLGNIWRFPFEVGSHGGGAFLLCYLVCIVVLGMPVLCAEFAMGRATRSNIFGAFRVLAPKSRWWMVGYLGILASLMILSFYSVVAGWTIEYCAQSAIGALDFADQSDYHRHFDEFKSGNWRPLIWTWIFLSLNFLVLRREVTKGIERFSNILMPLLFVLLIVFCVNSLLLPTAAEGLRFLFKPDFSQITPSVLLGALGQAFFSLSIGLGSMMTYASYFRPQTKLARTAAVTASLDTLIAMLAGVIIFPAVFMFGVSPEAGPTLVFETLPSIFHHLTGGPVWSALFFFLLFLASLTSTISMSEISIAFFIEEKGMKRNSATMLTSGIAFVFGSLCCLSFGCLSNLTVNDLNIFSIFDYVASNLLLPIGGIFIAVFAGWKMPKMLLRGELTNEGTLRGRFYGVLVFALRWVAPIGIGLVLLNSVGLL